jgi:hypothetical protein
MLVATLLFAIAVLAYPLTAGAVVNWTKYPSNPVLSGDDLAWDYNVGKVMVIIDSTAPPSDKFKMWYSGVRTISGVTDATRIGYATSSDGISWSKYNGGSNPVLGPGAEGSWDDKAVGYCWIIKETSGTTPYRMWYTGTNNPESGVSMQIGYAVSTDGINWSKNPSPVLTFGTSNDWDGEGVAIPTVIYDGDELDSNKRYKMFYSGWNSAWMMQGSGIGLAYSPDGITWTKYNNTGTSQNPYITSDPVLPIGNFLGAWDGGGLLAATVIKEGIYRMWYGGQQSEGPDRIGYASSVDGINWLKHPGNPILMEGAPGSFEQEGVIAPMVLKEGNKYRMWYEGAKCISQGNCRENIGYAESMAYQGPQSQLNQFSVATLHDYIDGTEKRYLMFSMAPQGASVLDTNETKVTGPNGARFVFSDSQLRLIAGEMFLSGNTEVPSFTGYGGDYTFTYRSNNDSQAPAVRAQNLTVNEIAYPVDGVGGLERHVDVGGNVFPSSNAYISGVTPTFRWKPYLGDNYYYRVRVMDWKRQTTWFQSDPVRGSLKDGSGYLQAQVPVDMPLKENTPYKWVVEVLDTNNIWSPHNRSRSQQWNFYTGTDTGSGFFSSIDGNVDPDYGVYLFGLRSLMNGVQTVAGAYIVNLARWEINDLHVEASGVTPLPSPIFNPDSDASTHYATPFSYHKTIIPYGLPLEEGVFTFSVSASGVTETAQKNWTQDDMLPLVTRDSMTPFDNEYLTTDQPTLRWWAQAQGGTSYRYRARIQAWNGTMIWQSDWIPDGELGQEMSVNVPAGVLRGGVYRWYVEVSDTNLRNMTRSQMLALNLAGGPSLKDELVLDYGAAYGLWHYDQTGGWQRWNTVNPSQIVTVDLNADGQDELVAAFPGYGLYTYDSAVGWQRINTVLPEVMGAGRNGIACDYGATYGLWLWDKTGGWQQINTVDPDKMIAADIDGDGPDELIVSFIGYGLFYYDDPGIWTRINTVIPDAMVRHSSGLVCDYGGTYGLWFYSQAGGWVRFNAVDPDKIVAVDIDNDGQDELVVSFIGYGLYTYEPVGSIWQRINTVIPEAMIRQGNGVVCDYGATYGLWKWTQAGNWVQRNYVDPGQMTVVDIDRDGLDELVVSFSGYGLYYYDEATGWHLLNSVLPVDMKPINFNP